MLTGAILAVYGTARKHPMPGHEAGSGRPPDHQQLESIMPSA